MKKKTNYNDSTELVSNTLEETVRIQDHNLVEKTDKFIEWVNTVINFGAYLDKKHNKPYNDEPIVFWIDLFCGAGGTSTGIHFSGTKSFVAACVNHDTNAINSHNENHPHTLHFIEDIKDFEVVLKLKYLCDRLREEFPGCYINLWGSLECINFSKAKGGQPRDPDSRTLADHMFMYLEEIFFDYFYVENVREFMAWGPMYIPVIKIKPSDDTGLGGEACSVKFKKEKKTKKLYTEVPWKPISKDKGKFYLSWVEKIKSYKFDYDFKILNSADFNACQTRERLFIQFARKEYSFSWPEQTHSKNGSNNTLFDMPKHRPVSEVLDFEDEGKSIFRRKKDLSEKTLKVILKGLVKAIDEKQSGFAYKYYGNGSNLMPLYKPCGTVTTKDRFGKIHLVFNQYKTGSITSVDKPNVTLTTIPKSNLLSFIYNPSHGGHTTSVDRPSPTVIARQDKAPLYLINALMNEYGIVDIKMRMFKISELLQIQGFPENYKLIGTQTEQKKYIGNAVEVNCAKAIIHANYNAIKQIKKIAS